MCQENLGPNPPSLMTENNGKRYVLKKDINFHGRKVKLRLLDKGKATLLQKGDFLYYYPQLEKLELFRLCEEAGSNCWVCQLRVMVKDTVLDEYRMSMDSYTSFVTAVAVSTGCGVEEISNSPELQIFQLV